MVKSFMKGSNDFYLLEVDGKKKTNHSGSAKPQAVRTRQEFPVVFLSDDMNKARSQ